MVFKTVCDSALSLNLYLCIRRVVRSSVVNINDKAVFRNSDVGRRELSETEGEAAVRWQASFTRHRLALCGHLCPFSFAFCCLRRSGRTAARWVGAAGRALRGLAWRPRLVEHRQARAHAAGDGLSRSPCEGRRRAGGRAGGRRACRRLGAALSESVDSGRTPSLHTLPDGLKWHLTARWNE